MKTGRLIKGAALETRRSLKFPIFKVHFIQKFRAFKIDLAPKSSRIIVVPGSCETGVSVKCYILKSGLAVELGVLEYSLFIESSLSEDNILVESGILEVGDCFELGIMEGGGHFESGALEVSSTFTCEFGVFETSTRTELGILEADNSFEQGISEISDLSELGIAEGSLPAIESRFSKVGPEAKPSVVEPGGLSPESRIPEVNPPVEYGVRKINIGKFHASKIRTAGKNNAA